MILLSICTVLLTTCDHCFKQEWKLNQICSICCVLWYNIYFLPNP